MKKILFVAVKKELVLVRMPMEHQVIQKAILLTKRMRKHNAMTMNMQEFLVH